MATETFAPSGMEQDRRNPKYSCFQKSISEQGIAQIPLPCRGMVLGSDILGVGKWVHCFVRPANYKPIGLPAWSSVHCSHNSRGHGQRRAKARSASHCSRAKIPHILGSANPAVLYGLPDAHAIYQLAILFHPHSRHDCVLGMAILLHDNEQSSCSTSFG